VKGRALAAGKVGCPPATCPLHSKEARACSCSEPRAAAGSSAESWTLPDPQRRSVVVVQALHRQFTPPRDVKPEVGEVKFVTSMTAALKETLSNLLF